MTMSDLSISEIQIIPINLQRGLSAFASCVINNQFHLNSLGIYTSPSSPLGFRLTYPTKVLGNGSKIDIFYPINKEVGTFVEFQIVEQYKKLMEELMKGDL
jgi:SpoVG.